MKTKKLILGFLGIATNVSSSTLQQRILATAYSLTNMAGLVLGAILVLASATPGHASPPTQARSTDASLSATPGPANWTVWSQRVGPRVPSSIHDSSVREAWWTLLVSLSAELRVEVEAVLHSSDPASISPSAHGGDGPDTGVGVQLSHLDDLHERWEHPVFRLLALRVLAACSDEPLHGDSSCHSVLSGADPLAAYLDACSREASLMNAPDPVVVVAYVAACRPQLGSGLRPTIEPSALAEAARRVPVERWALPFWEVARETGGRRADRVMQADAAAALSVIEGRACASQCMDALSPASVLEAQRALYSCLPAARAVGRHELASPSTFATCARARLPKERHHDVVWIHVLPFE